MSARIFGLFLVVFLALWLVGCSGPVVVLPTATGRPQSGAFPTQNASGTPVPALLEKRLILLEWPQKIREKDSGLIFLEILIDEQGQLTATPQVSNGQFPVEIPDIYQTHNVVAVARLDMAGVEAYRDEIREPLLPGKTVAFRWSIRANEAGVYRGVVWLQLEFVPKSGGQVERMQLLARSIEVEAVTVFGLSGSLARVVGTVGLLASTILGYPLIQRWIEERLRRKKAVIVSQSISADTKKLYNEEEDPGTN